MKTKRNSTAWGIISTLIAFTLTMVNAESLEYQLTPHTTAVELIITTQEFEDKLREDMRELCEAPQYRSLEALIEYERTHPQHETTEPLIKSNIWITVKGLNHRLDEKGHVQHWRVPSIKLECLLAFDLDIGTRLGKIADDRYYQKTACSIPCGGSIDVNDYTQDRRGTISINMLQYEPLPNRPCISIRGGPQGLNYEDMYQKSFNYKYVIYSPVQNRDGDGETVRVKIILQTPGCCEDCCHSCRCTIL